MYPTLSRIARDVCAIPASSVPCERLFSGGAETATDRRARLGAERFEQLQVLKFAWRKSAVDRTAANSVVVEEVEEVLSKEFKELLHLDDEMAKWDCPAGEVVAV
jgi:hypothetical protein